MRIQDAVRSSEMGRYAIGLVCLFLLGFTLGCASEEPAEENELMEEPVMEESSGEPRIYFISPQDGDTVTSPVQLEFGHENFGLAPKETFEPNTGHHHVGVDADCLPPGEIIPEASPWIHLGDASSQMEMQLPPGEHRLTIQLGDGEHRTLDQPGLCQTITITVEEGQS